MHVTWCSDLDLPDKYIDYLLWPPIYLWCEDVNIGGIFDTASPWRLPLSADWATCKNTIYQMFSMCSNVFYIGYWHIIGVHTNGLIVINKTSKTDVAPSCYKWVDGLESGWGEIWLGWSLKHLYGANTGGDDDDEGIKGKKQQHILREINCQPAN